MAWLLVFSGIYCAHWVKCCASVMTTYNPFYRDKVQHVKILVGLLKSFILLFFSLIVPVTVKKTGQSQKKNKISYFYLFPFITSFSGDTLEFP